MKLLLRTLCITLLICALTLVISAVEHTFVYEYSELDLTIQFSESSTLSNEARQLIADSIAYDEPIPQVYSLCWLLGHDTYVETVTAVYHKKSDISPRCQLEIYDITRCSNCDYIYPVLVSSKYIVCCPPDASIVSLD